MLAQDGGSGRNRSKRRPPPAISLVQQQTLEYNGKTSSTVRDNVQQRTQRIAVMFSNPAPEEECSEPSSKRFAHEEQHGRMADAQPAVRRQPSRTGPHRTRPGRERREPDNANPCWTAVVSSVLAVRQNGSRRGSVSNARAARTAKNYKPSLQPADPASGDNVRGSVTGGTPRGVQRSIPHATVCTATVQNRRAKYQPPAGRKRRTDAHPNGKNSVHARTVRFA